MRTSQSLWFAAIAMLGCFATSAPGDDDGSSSSAMVRRMKEFEGALREHRLLTDRLQAIERKFALTDGETKQIHLGDERHRLVFEITENGDVRINGALLVTKAGDVVCRRILVRGDAASGARGILIDDKAIVSPGDALFATRDGAMVLGSPVDSSRVLLTATGLEVHHR